MFKKTKEFCISFTLAVGSSGKFGIFAFRTCATLEKWLLNVESISVETVTISSFTFSLSLGLARFGQTTLLMRCHVVFISVADSKKKCLLCYGVYCGVF